MTKLLSLDLGTDMGWCISEDSNILDSGHIKFKSPFHSESYMELEMFLHGKAIDYDLTLEGSLIVIEKPNTFGPGYHAKRVLFGMLGVVELVFNDKNITMVSATTIKKFITGSGKAGKPEMVAAVNKLIKKKITNDNEADAIAFTKYYWEVLYDKKD